MKYSHHSLAHLRNLSISLQSVVHVVFDVAMHASWTDALFQELVIAGGISELLNPVLVDSNVVYPYIQIDLQ